MSSRSHATAQLRYSFDEANRLVVKGARPAADALRPVHVLEGVATTDRHNRLLYHVDATATQDGYTGPHRLELDGTWALTRNHELALTLHEAAHGRRQRLYLKGAVVKARAQTLTFALQRYELDARKTAQHLTLTGRWEADRENRLTFLVEKADGSEDQLTFHGGWQIGEHHELLYQYRQIDLARRRRHTHTVRFAGLWDVSRADRLVFRVDGSTDSSFEFRASLQSRSLNARQGRLAYQVGIGLSGGGRLSQRVALFGRWKVHRDLSVSFEVPYADGRRQATRLAATVGLTTKDAVTVELLDQHRKPLGLAVTFTRGFLDDAQLFLRLQKAGKDIEAIGGVQVKF